jgi:hypothetical protein
VRVALLSSEKNPRRDPSTAFFFPSLSTASIVGRPLFAFLFFF